MIQRISDHRKCDERGFTLIELLVVIIILGILSAVVVFAVRGAGDKGERAAYAADRETIRTAQEVFCGKFGRYDTEEQLAGLAPAPDGSTQQFLSEPSEYHDIELQDSGPCGNTGFQVVSDLGYGEVPLPLDQQILTVGYRGDPWANSKLRLSRFALDTRTTETLTRLGNDYSVSPRLATTWELVNPGNNAAYPGNPTWRFTLRPGVKFHNGVDLTADAVKYSMDRLVSKKDDFTAKLGASSTVVVNPLTVEITPAQANLRLPEILVHPTYAIIGPGTEPSTIPATPDTVVGTGPFKFQSYTGGVGGGINVVRNDTYWGPKAKLQEIRFKFIADSAARRLALESGDIDFMYDVGRQQVAGLRQQSALEVVTAPVSYVYLMYMNLNGTDTAYNELTSEPVRRALALSIDRQDFINDNWEPGVASLIHTPSPPSILGPFASTITGYTHDLTQANDLLDSEGWTCGGGAAGADTPCATDPQGNVTEIRKKDGEELDLYLLSSTSDADVSLAQDWKKRALQAGIRITIGNDLTSTQRTDRKNAGTWDLDTSNPNQNDANPAFLLTLQWWSKSTNRWVSCLSGTTPCGPWQQAGATFDNLVEQALAAPSIPAAQDFAAQAMDLLIDQEAKTIPLAGLSRVYAMKDGVEGFTPPHPAESFLDWSTVFRTE